MPMDIKKDFLHNKTLYLMIIPVLAYFIVFKYIPMYGASIAFKDFSPVKGILGSDWVGLKHFLRFFNSVYFVRVMSNTFIISVATIIWGFPAPIIFALLLNEVKQKWFKSSVQTITYLPHFISLVIIVGLVKDFCLTDGFINDFAAFFGMARSPILQNPDYFRTIYIITEIWQTIGWNSIIYLAALSGVDVELYEAAKIDGANRWKQIRFVTLPGISSTIVILLILRIGNVLSVGFEKIILMYNPSTYSVADVISSYVYRTGLVEMNFSYSAAIGLLNSVLNFAFLIIANNLSRKFSETSLW